MGHSKDCPAGANHAETAIAEYRQLCPKVLQEATGRQASGDTVNRHMGADDPKPALKNEPEPWKFAPAQGKTYPKSGYKALAGVAF